MQQSKTQSRRKLNFKSNLTIKTKNLNFKLDNQRTSDSSVKKRLRKSSINLKSFNSIELRRQTFLKKGFEDCYDIEEKVGEGGHSVVYKCKDLNDGKCYAVKVTRKNDPENLQSLKEQYRILTSLSHEGILQGYYLFLNERKSSCHLVCQYYNFPNLRQFFIAHQNMPIEENKARQIIKLILKALLYLHEQKVSHRDLKPENILYDEATSSIKIIDFQVAKMSRYTHERLQMWTKTGTPTYRSPQLLNGSYNQLTDMWSLGIITYQMIAGKFPFKITYEKNLYDEIVNFVPNLTDVQISESAKNFITKLLKRDPKERMSAKQALSHPFILSLTISNPSSATFKKLNSNSDNQTSFQKQEESQSPKSKFYDQNTKFTFLSNVDKDIGIRFCED